MKQIVEKTIKWGDLDAIGIVFYPRYYEWIDACTHQFFDLIKLPFDTLWEKWQVLFGLVETSCKYKTPGRYHQLIHIITQIETLTAKTITFKHTMIRAVDDAVMLTAVEQRICMQVTDLKNIRAVDIPEELFNVFKKTMDT
ncbi:MAG: acyl-CoA thioesterase [Desulfobacteraceae bacterium]